MSEVSFLTANGLRFGYLSDGEGPLVLLLHGFPDTAHTWDYARPLLAKAGFRAVSPFLRGYHPTGIPLDGRYDSEALGRDALALIEALGEESAVVVGHDWGASAAYCAAAMEPGRVRLLITLAIPHPGALLPTPRLLYGVRHFFSLSRGGAEAMVRRNDFAHIDELVRRWSPAWDLPESETRTVKEAFSHPGCLAAALGYYRALRPWLPAALRRRVTVPTVAFAGEQDGLLRLSDFEKGKRRFAGSYEVVAMPGGHFMHREHPDHFGRELLRALARYLDIKGSPPTL